MEHTKLPLTTWFLAFYFLSQSKSGISALALKRHLGVSYPTAWLLRHKLMQVMFEREQASVLSGRIEIDDAFLGGEQAGRQGRGGNKVPFVAAVETDLRGRPQIVRFDRVDNHGLRAIQRCGGDEAAVQKVGIHYATEQCHDLLDHGVDGIHFYTLNKSHATREIYSSHGIRDSAAVRPHS